MIDWSQIGTTAAFTSVLTWIGLYFLKPYATAYLAKKAENLATTEDMDSLNRKLEELKRDFAADVSYQTEKGRNAATKEDIDGLTSQVEAIRIGYLTSLEVVRSELSKQGTMHRLAAEREFGALAEIGDALCNLRHDTVNLRPFLDIVDPNESKSDRQQRRWEAWGKSYDSFLRAVEKHRLFLPPILYEELLAILKSSRKEAIDFETAVTHGSSLPGLWSPDKIQANIIEFESAIDRALARIQARCGITS
jgi:hypothetical protein